MAKKRTVEGEPNSSFRKLSLVDETDFKFSFVERRGSSGHSVEDTGDVVSYIEALSTLESRKRGFQSAEEGIHETEKLLRNFENKLSKLRLADAFFRAERRYWETRNSATEVQKGRQDEVGLGWGNVDHHTFRSSRGNFAALIRFFDYLGLERREIFRAGGQSGWGAQILEDKNG